MFQFLGIEALTESFSCTFHPSEVEHPSSQVLLTLVQSWGISGGQWCQDGFGWLAGRKLMGKQRNQKLRATDKFLIHPGNTTYDTYIYNILYIYAYICPTLLRLINVSWRFEWTCNSYQVWFLTIICLDLSKLSNISRSSYRNDIGSRKAPFCCSSQLRCSRCSVFWSSRHLQVAQTWKPAMWLVHDRLEIWRNEEADAALFWQLSFLA